MLTAAWRTLPLLAAAVAVMVVGLGAPAMAQLDPDDPCASDPTSVECEEYLQRLRERNPGTGSPGGNGCGPHNGVVVPCVDERLGGWLGTPAVIYGFGPAPYDLVGCWARRTGELPVVRPRPEWSYPIHHGELDTGGAGRWVSLSCLGAEGVYPDDVQVAVATVWLLAGDLPGPDPQALARRALASIDLHAPQLVLAPPAAGSVPLGMPVWLAVEESAAAWGPISSGPVCEQGLCVEVTATAEQVEWDMGDGSTVQCGRGQNTTWQPGMNFLAPADACHHYYQQPSRSQPGGSYTATATITWRAEWAGGGQSGVFTDVTDVCGAAGDEPCASTVAVTVEEIQVLGTR